jgi:two-component system OmpR family sensor kinase
LLLHEKRAFWKFFSIYFGSVALLILAAGFFYFGEQEKMMIKKEHFSMIEFTRQLKMKLHPKDDHIKYELKNIVIDNFNMNNFTIKEDKFMKYMPYNWSGGYLLVTKDKVHFHENLLRIKLKIIAVQAILLTLFAFISYILSIKALQPMQNAITKLDNFSKDLIHDLNTPITSMFLNIKLLELKPEFQESKPLNRIKRSLEDIGELHSNLTVLLQEDTMVVQNENLFEIVNEVLATHKKIYTNINFILIEDELYGMVNKDAFKQIVVNIVSNACKYNVENGYVKIYMEDGALCIEDGGIGILNPQQIFQRSYKEHASGHGIGLDIVKRLCEVMDIEIGVVSQLNKGTTISLKCKQK